MATAFFSGAQTAANVTMAAMKVNPVLAGTFLAGAALVAIPSIAVVPTVYLLSTVGFGSGGVGGATLAASVHAGIGNVVAPSLFATLTSAAMNGYGIAVLTGAAQAVGSTIMGLSAGVQALITARGEGHD